MDREEEEEAIPGLRRAAFVGARRWHGSRDLQLPAPFDGIPAMLGADIKAAMKVPVTGWLDNVTWNAQIAREKRRQIRCNGPGTYDGPAAGVFERGNGPAVNPHLRGYLAKLKTSGSRGKSNVDEALATAGPGAQAAPGNGDEAPEVEVEAEGVVGEENEDEALARSTRLPRTTRVPCEAERAQLKKMLLSVRGMIAEGISNARSNTLTHANGLAHDTAIPRDELGDSKFTAYQRDSIRRWEYLMRRFSAVLLSDELGSDKIVVAMGTIQRLLDEATANGRIILVGVVLQKGLVGL